MNITLPHDVSRCSGRISTTFKNDDWPEVEMCDHRETCQRWLAFTRWDALAGVPDYKGISVNMAVEDCRDKIEVEI